RAWLGVAIQPLQRYSGHEAGILVGDVLEGGPAAEAGVQSGDILLRVNGEATTVRFEEQLPEFNQMAAALPIGEPVEVTVLRGGEEKTFTVTPREREDMLPDQKEFKQWGVTVRDISYVLAKEMKRDNQEGVLVTSVRPGGPAGEAKPSLDRNDIIVEVNDQPVKNVEDLRRVTDELTEGAEDPISVLTTFERKAATHVAVVDVGISELNDPGLEVKKAWLPVETQVITRDIASQMSEEDLKGFRITQVYEGSTADEAGLEVGDLIVSVDGTLLTASAPEHYEELPALVRNYRVGTMAELEVIREGEKQTIPVELVLAPKLQREMMKYRDESFEFTVRDITFFDRADERWELEQQGVLVEEVRPGGWASLGLLNVGDLIVEVDGQPITDVSTLENVMDKIVENEPKSVVFKVLRGIYNTYIEIVPDWEDNG
ncbi:MAG: PDZ domain-containing protein, partial [Candidatus Hydrogenedentales bacterium]